MTGIKPPTGDARVYVARARRGIPAHRPTGDGITACERSTRTGLIYPAARAIDELAVTWCVPCWTPGAGVDRTPGVSTGGQLPPVPLGSFWRLASEPEHRLQAVTVTTQTVVAHEWHRYAGTWRRNGRAPVTVSRDDWHRLYRRETAADLGSLR